MYKRTVDPKKLLITIIFLN